VIWIAPSGGRDRPNPDTKEFEIANFDSKAVDMFRLLAQKASDKVRL
jgi:glycerol-3-phosphate O-acyltransferase